MDKTEEICGYRPEEKEVNSFFKNITRVPEIIPKPQKKKEYEKPYIPTGEKKFNLKDLANMDRKELKRITSNTLPVEIILVGNRFNPNARARIRPNDTG